jgi:hypothetical protein
MDKLTKIHILLTINQIKLEQLEEFIKSGDISLDEMIANNLNGNTVNLLRLLQNREKQNQITEEEMITTCRKIENNELNAGEIKNLLLEGKVTKGVLLKHTSLTDQMVSKIENYQKRSTSFSTWANLPELQKGNTDLYFFGQPGSGKSCILASIFYYLEEQGMIINNAHNPEGNRYRNQLRDELSYGILPDSTAAEGVNYIPIELINPDNEGARHPLNFIEMSGELFNKAYEGGISEENLAAKNYLNNTNRKLIYFVLDYDQHERSKTFSSGPLQSSKMQTILALLDQFGTLNYTDGIYLVVTKSDLFPYGVDRFQYAKQFIESSYKGFIVNCKELQQRYRNNFKILVYPYSIGEVRFQNMLIRPDLGSPEMVIGDVLTQTFFKKKNFIQKFFSR